MSLEENNDLIEKEGKLSNFVKKTKNIILDHKVISIIIAAVLLFCVIGLPIILSKNSKLTGNDLKAYELIVKYSKDFKDPSSVRVISGYLGKDSYYFVLSAKNGFGARSTEACMIWTYNGKEKLDIIDKTSSLYVKGLFEYTTCFDADKVNAALDKKWKNVT